ncbi:MAG: penicillin-binding protein [Actinomycetota bacterium]|nr:penicillin-binding protein [Actinomycetota bacterium]
MPSSRPSRSPSRSRRRGARHRRSWFWRYRRLLFLAALLAFTALAGAAFVLVRVPLPPETPPAQTTFLTDITGARLATLTSGVDRVSTRLGDVPPVVIDAVLATEDRHFFQHGGIDPVGIVRATVNDLRSKGSLQGGSTITQQYVKNTYVGRERTVWRKLKEAALSVKIERKYTKRQILERYLNAIYLGRGAYGVQAASRAYFGKDVKDLGLREGAYIAGLIRAPQLADAYLSPQTAADRRARTLESMIRAGMITPAQRDEVNAQPLQSYVIAKEKQDPAVVNPQDGTQYYVEYVRRQLIKRFGLTDEQIYSGGLRVKTTLDPKMQHQAYDAVYGLLNRSNDPAGALVAVDDEGRIRAMVGGKDYGKSKVNLAAGLGYGGTGRQPGSTFKPFLLAETVKEGYSVESAFPAPKRVVLPKADNGKDYPVENYEGEDFGGGPMNLIDATRESVNTVYAQLQDAVGPNHLVDMAHALGVRSDLQPNASLVLGTSEVSVVEMAGAYSTFARDGEQIDPLAVTEIDTADGKVFKRPRANPTRVLDRKATEVVNFCLQQVVERGTGTAAQIGRPVAGKTGTTSDYADAWFIGYTPKLTTAVWMGFPEGSSHTMRSVRGIKVAGGTFPASIFRRFMTAAMRDGDYGGDFASVSRFPGKVLSLRSGRVQYSTSTTGGSTTTSAGHFTSTTAPGASPTTAPRATTTVPKATTTTKPPATSTTKPP